jgi:hypothetical protein
VSPKKLQLRVAPSLLAKARFLNAEELKKLFTEKITPYKKLKNGKEGINLYKADGTYFRIDGTWKITEDGYKCQTKKGKQKCSRIYKDEEKYIGVSKDGDELFEFTATSLADGKVVTINPVSGKFLSNKEVRQLYHGNLTSWKSLQKDSSGKTAYYEDGTRGGMKGTWRITPDGFKCQTPKRKNKEYCGKVYMEGSTYFLTNKNADKATFSFSVM